MLEAVCFLYQNTSVLGCDQVRKERNCIQLCQRAELLHIKSCSCKLLSFSKGALARFGWLCTARFVKLMLSVSTLDWGAAYLSCLKLSFIILCLM